MLINCRGSLLDLSQPKIMAILNLTPDSFYDGGKHITSNNNTLLIDKQRVIDNIDELLLSKPSIIDIGGMSSRPGSSITTIEEEWGRIAFTIEHIRKEFPLQLLSVDTIHSEIARRSLELGVHIINDISGGLYDKNMLQTVADFQAVFCMMHMQGEPATMQKYTDYPEGVTMAVLKYFMERLRAAKTAGVENCIIDPGFGFSKTVDQNYELLKKMHVLKILDKPILAGISRKSMIYKVLGRGPKEALNGTSVLHLKALQEGASLLRVHDVKEAQEVITLFAKMS